MVDLANSSAKRHASRTLGTRHLLRPINARGLGSRKRIFGNDHRQSVRPEFDRFFDVLFSDLRVLDGFCADECGLPSFNIQLYIC